MILPLFTHVPTHAQTQTGKLEVTHKHVYRPIQHIHAHTPPHGLLEGSRKMYHQSAAGGAGKMDRGMQSQRGCSLLGLECDQGGLDLATVSHGCHLAI